jgi:hypothetical protein
MARGPSDRTARRALLPRGFTVPDLIATIAFQNQTVVYDILFRAASETLRAIAADPEHLGAEIGFLGVLHTWGQNLLQNPHP